MQIYQAFIDEMLAVLLPSLADKQEAKQLLLNYWNQRIAFIWSVQDVVDSCKFYGGHISEQQASMVLKAVMEDYDPTCGVNQETFYREFCSLFEISNV